MTAIENSQFVFIASWLADFMVGAIFLWVSQPAYTCSKSIIKTLVDGVKSVQNENNKDTKKTSKRLPVLRTFYYPRVTDFNKYRATQKVRHSGRGERVKEKSDTRGGGITKKMVSFTQNFSGPIFSSTKFCSSVSHEPLIIFQCATVKAYLKGYQCVIDSCTTRFKAL